MNVRLQSVMPAALCNSRFVSSTTNVAFSRVYSICTLSVNAIYFILSKLVTERMCDHTNEGELGEFRRALNMRDECIVCTLSHALQVPPRIVMREGISFHQDVGGRVGLEVTGQCITIR
jgi:hypothetical protein